MEAWYHKGSVVTVSFNHTIVFAKNNAESAGFYTKLFELPEPTAWGPFLSVELEHGVTIQFAAPDIEIQPQHYAFLVTEPEFDRIYRWITDAGMEHWADPQTTRPGEYNTNHGGRGVYFKDPAGHNLEVLTQPYGSAG
jgi:catechol 2,3-dioxygenase-like lactoylglutathione lyase family enzyme